MQIPVFSAEPLGDNAATSRIPATALDHSGTDQAEQFHAEFLLPDIAGAEVQRMHPGGTPQIAQSPIALVSLHEFASALSGLSSNSAADHDAGALQGSYDRNAMSAPGSLEPEISTLAVTFDSSGKRATTTLAAALSSSEMKPLIAANATGIARDDHSSLAVQPSDRSRSEFDSKFPAKAQNLDEPTRLLRKNRPQSSDADLTINLTGQRNAPLRLNDLNLVQEGTVTSKAKELETAQPALGKEMGVATNSTLALSKPTVEHEPRPGIDNRKSTATTLPANPDRSPSRPPLVPQTSTSELPWPRAHSDGNPAGEPPQTPRQIHPIRLAHKPLERATGVTTVDQAPVNTDMPRSFVHPAANADTRLPANLPNFSDSKADKPSQLASKENVAAHPEYSVEFVGRKIGRRSTTVAGLGTHLPFNLTVSRTTHHVRAQVKIPGVPFGPHPAPTDRAEILMQPHALPVKSEAAIDPHLVAKLPANSVLASPATPPPTPPAQIISPLSKNIIGELSAEGVDAIEQTLTENGSDRIVRDSRVSILDVLRGPSANLGRVELARLVSSQIGEAARASLDGSIEVRLSPEELGRVRLLMSQSELGLTVAVIAERVETLELIRRNTDILAQDLRGLGHQNIAFSFDQGAKRQSFDNAAEISDITAEEPEADSDGSSHNLSAAGFVDDGRLDIRL
ncbi:MAG: flagellar hook-length control protein FliK [Boseongicola sp.]